MTDENTTVSNNSKSNIMMPLLLVGVAVGGFYWYSKDNTPIGLTVTNVIEGTSPIGETSDGSFLTAGAVEGTWRADEDSLPVASESAEKPLLVVYEDGTPVHAEVITISEWVADETPTECVGVDEEGNPLNETQECADAYSVIQNSMMELWRAFAKGAGATEESIEATFPTQEESTIQEAESWLGLKTNNMFINTLQSHQRWG